MLLNCRMILIVVKQVTRTITFNTKKTA